MVDFANRGLTSSADFDQALRIVDCSAYPCAFPGINPNAPPFPFLNLHRTIGLQRIANQTHPERAAPVSRRAAQ